MADPILYYKIIWIVHAFLFGLQVCFHSAMKHKNDESNMVGFVSKFWEFTVSLKKVKCTYALCIYSLSLF